MPIVPDEPITLAMSACYWCGRVFSYDPDRVPAIRASAALAEVVVRHEQAGPGHDGPVPARCAACRDAWDAAWADATAEPVCHTCCKRINPERARRGLPLLPEGDTAEDLAWGRV